MNETMITTIETNNSTDAEFRKMLAKLNPDLASKTLEPSLTSEIKGIRNDFDLDSAVKAGLEASKNGDVDIESVRSLPKSSDYFLTIYSEQRKEIPDLENIVRLLETQPKTDVINAEIKGVNDLIKEMKVSSETVGGNNNQESKEISGLRKAYNNIVSFVRK